MQARSLAGLTRKYFPFVSSSLLSVALITSANAEAPPEPGDPDFVEFKKAEVQHQQALIKAGWRMIWQDEFDDAALDLEHWSHEVNCFGGGNNERQCYTDRAENSYVEDGLLNIVARE